MSGNYEKKVEEVAELLGPGLHAISIKHDDWCAYLAGTGPCDCDPDVTVASTDCGGTVH